MRSLNINLTMDAIKTGRRTNFFSQYFLLFVLLLFCMYQYGIHRIYGFSIYPDEFGYWASAAEWIGYDWSEMASLASYYSFGYALILAPILLLCKSGVAAYRAAVTVNVLLQCLSIGFLWDSYKKILHTGSSDLVEHASFMAYEAECSGQKMPGRQEKGRLVFAVGAAVFYPVWTFYTQMTLVEALLAFLYIMICWLFLRFLEKPTWVRAMLLSIAFIYLHFVHMRTVGVVIAAVITVFYYALHVREARKAIVAAAVLLLCGAFIGMQIRNNIIGSIYMSAESESAAGNAIAAMNGYAAQLANVKVIFNWEGMLLLLQSCAGKLYYLGMSSFGLIYPAIGICVKKVVELLSGLLFKREGLKGRVPEAVFWQNQNAHEVDREEALPGEKQIATRDWMFLFLLLSLLGQFLISAVYMRYPGRLDGIVYGRYNDYLVPVFIGLGVSALWESRHLLRHILISIGISALLFAVSLWSALHSGAVLMHGCHAVGLNYLSDDLHFYQITPEFIKAYGFGILLMLLAAGCIAFARKDRQGIFRISEAGIGAVLVMEVLLTFGLNHKYIYYFNDMNYYDLEIYEYIEEFEKSPAAENIRNGAEQVNEGVNVYYLHDGGQVYINLIQFAMQDKTMQFIYEEKDDGSLLSWEELKPMLPEDGFVIADCNNAYLSQLEERYQKCVESKSGGFVLFSAGQILP